MTYDLNKLIGVPFKLNRNDLTGCDCRGIVCLYYKYMKEKILPFTDGKRILFRDKRKDNERIIDVLKQFCEQIPHHSIEEGDIVLIKTIDNTGALGVCINKKYILHMDQVVGSCLSKIDDLRKSFIVVYRPKQEV
jgi:hypothetical protein